MWLLRRVPRSAGHAAPLAEGLHATTPNIAAGIWYDRQNFVVWTERRPLLDKIKFMFGSYNAGRASILQAQRVAAGDGLNGTLWSAIEQGLPRVTGRNSGETLRYVDRILDIKQVLR